MGKGGVGKTTLAAALALAHARAGSRVGLVALADGEELEAALRAGWGAPPPTLEVVVLDARRAVDDVVGKLLPVAALAQLVTTHPAYDAVYRIAPGVKELGLLHKLLVLADQGPYDRLVVDGLATGHGTHFLEAPRKSARMLVGMLAERAAAIDAALTDPARTSVVLATTMEEMPVRETEDLVARLRAGRFPLQAVVANRVPERVFVRREALAAVEALAERGAASLVASEVGAPWRTVQRFVRAAAHVERRAREAEPLLHELKALGLPVARVPVVPDDDRRLGRVAAILAEAGL